MESSTDSLDNLMDEANTLTIKIRKIMTSNVPNPKRILNQISKNFDNLLDDVREFLKDPPEP